MVPKPKCYSALFWWAFLCRFNINGCQLGLDPFMTGIKEGNNSVAYWSVKNIESCVKKSIILGATLVEHVKEVGGGY